MVGGFVSGLTATLLALLLIGCLMSLLFERYRSTVRQLRAAHRQSVAESFQLAEMSNELRRAKEAAERSEQAKSRFLSTAAHELRTPMPSAHGFVELLASSEFDRSTSQSIARTIHRQSARVVVDEVRLRQAVTNVLSNAFK